ncbi:MAG: alpha-L-glutamate ligase-like protein, partial [Flavobacteriales bacterium]|nr:alpha-L-glutamate ligase-like protein [Flavobacteriales bacterium]
NLHQGAIGVGVDSKTGVLGKAYDGKNHLDHHPDSKVTLEGRQIPFWTDIIDISHKVYDSFPFGYLGIDVALDQNKGPLILEINVRPGLEIQNVNQVGINALLDG